jgi:hypothetical protein
MSRCRAGEGDIRIDVLMPPVFLPRLLFSCRACCFPAAPLVFLPDGSPILVNLARWAAFSVLPDGVPIL